MKINNISSTQFAGIRNIDIPLEDGLNVIYGKNESGKSTLVNLLSRILFQNSKLDRRSDKDFLELYYFFNFSIDSLFDGIHGNTVFLCECLRNCICKLPLSIRFLRSIKNRL